MKPSRLLVLFQLAKKTATVLMSLLASKSRLASLANLDRDSVTVQIAHRPHTSYPTGLEKRPSTSALSPLASIPKNSEVIPATISASDKLKLSAITGLPVDSETISRIAGLIASDKNSVRILREPEFVGRDHNSISAKDAIAIDDIVKEVPAMELAAKIGKCGPGNQRKFIQLIDKNDSLLDDGAKVVCTYCGAYCLGSLGKLCKEATEIVATVRQWLPVGDGIDKSYEGGVEL